MAFNFQSSVGTVGSVATGKVPAKLEELDVRSVKSDCPAALDPMTGKPFGYKVEKGNVVRLTGLPCDGDVPTPATSIEYVLEFKKLQAK